MAVTKIWNIRGKAGSPLEYIANPEKTEREFTEPEKQALQDVIAYTTNEDKTEKFYYTSGINCSVEFARDQFDTVKMRFGKYDGNVAYHAYQSFREGEVTPDEAHAIGVQLAKELWGDRFQMVVATHVNTKCVHNHIIEGKSDTGFPFFMEKLTNTSFYISFPVANGRVVVKGGSP